VEFNRQITHPLLYRALYQFKSSHRR